MADDINKKITIDVEVSTDGQDQINQYKAAFDSLRSSITNLSNPLANLSGAISSFDKDVSKLTVSIDKLNDQNKDLNSSGNKVKGVVTDLIGSFASWDGILKALTITVDGFESALTGGLALITTFLPQIISWVGALFKGDTTLSALNKTLKDNKLIMDAVNQARAQGKDDAQQELVHLKMLYNAAQDQNISLKDRKKIVAELQSQYPAYFGNMSSEAIMTGKAAKKYDDLTKAIIATARAKAAEELITKNQVRQIGNDGGLQKLNADLKEYRSQLLKAQKDLSDYEKKPVIGAMTEDDSMASLLTTKIKGIQNDINNAEQSISHLNTDSILLNKQNEALAKTVIGDAEKNGAAVLGVATNTDQKLGQLHRSSLTNQKSFSDEADSIRKESLNRELQATYSAYGVETLAESNHYQDELKKLDEFLNKKQITETQHKAAKDQILKEYHANLAGIADKYNEQDKARLQQAQNELAELQIKGMREGADQQIAELQQAEQEKNQQYKKLDAESLERITKLSAEIEEAQKTDPQADISSLQKQLDTETQLRAINGKQQIEIEQQTANAIAKIKSREAEGNKDALLKLEEQKDKQIIELSDKYNKEKNDKAKKAAEELKNFEVQQEKKLSEEAFAIVSQTIKQEADAKIAGLEQDKEAELNNSSLTSAQKLAIEQKFKQQEAQVKIKAFKQEQEASIAQTIINGAVAITKASAQSGVLAAFYVPAIIAETAVEIAKIAAQKPPAYASGGVHYSSDGRGGVLPGYSKTDNTNAWLRSGEGIVVSEAMRVPWARNLVSAINVGFGGRDFSIANPGRGYAVGGIFTDGGDANRYYNQPVHDQKNLANSIAYQMINNFPPVYVDVKDINNQQNILAQTINRVNL